MPLTEDITERRPVDTTPVKGPKTVGGFYKYLRAGHEAEGGKWKLTILDYREVRANRTHVATCETHSWDGTPDDFRDNFEKL